MSAPTHVAVVVPARNEEQLLPRCLAAVSMAVETLKAETPIPTRVIMVLDSCTDGTSSAVTGHEVEICVTNAGVVGTARAIGVESAAQWAGPGADLWVANTDADTVVPANWLSVQIELAAQGAEMVVGTVEPDPSGTCPQAHAQWLSRHTLADGHAHVHGANLGFSLAAYRAAGGYQHVAAHEDVLLVEAIRRAGRTWVATDATRVITSSRRASRVDGGFATYLSDLDGANT